MSDAPRNRYRADLRELEFQFFEQAKLGELLGKAPYESWGPDEARMVLQQARQFAYEESGPLNSSGDREGCKVENGQVVAPSGYKGAFLKLYEVGLKQIMVPEEYGGQAGPHSLATVVEEMLIGSNIAWSMYSGLTFGAADLLENCASPKQKELILENMFQGRWGGTMCLTEPHAGSDVGSAKSRAVKQADGRYKIYGTKCFISAGDHDFTENIIHLVLARIDGAPAGTKGLSLFIVPKFRITADGKSGDRNDVNVGGVEHKLGIVGNATCVLNFGENDDCYGELVGGVANEGMKQMFVMMNTARLAVGIQSLAVASQAYLCALSYAKDRKQGPSIDHFKDPSAPRVSIINHPDIRRSLLEMKAKVEGIRALIMRVAAHHDRSIVAAGKDDLGVAYHKGQVELLTPLVKAYSSDQAFRVCEIAIQVHGGAGFIKDYGVEQDLRDSKIFSIYEGTNHIQALDLVSRKLGQRGGANLQALIAEIQTFADQHKSFGPEMETLAKGTEVIVGCAMRFMGWGQENKLAIVALNANRFLEMMSELVVGYLLLEGAVIADEALHKGSKEKDFYEGKKKAALWFARNVLPLLSAKGELLGNEDDSAMTVSEESFATV